MKKLELVETAAADSRTGNRIARSQQYASSGILLRQSPALSRTSSREIWNAEEGTRVAAEVRLRGFASCKCSQQAYRSAGRVLRHGDVLPQLQGLGGSVNMALPLQVVSSHLLGALDIESALSVQPTFVNRLVPHAATEAAALKPPAFPRLFLLDGCSLTLPLGPLSSRLRGNSPGSKFLVLLAPDQSGAAEMVRLFHWGIDGMLVLDQKWKEELPKAVLALLGNRLWVPRGVLAAFINQMKILLDRQLLPGHSLTAREAQVLQLLFRRLTNKEIACDLHISERTAKFHVCNVLNKLGLENRRNLLESFGLVDKQDVA